MKKSSQWFDLPDALEILAKKNLPEHVVQPLKSIIENGVAVIHGANEVNLCANVIHDYEKYSSENSDYVKNNLDDLGREKRLVNFHHYSENALKVVANQNVLRVLDELFMGDTCVYTSLTFKYGTQQPVHRDTPHFATWPLNSFCGVWTALEDIDPDAGPIFYHPGAHRFTVNQFLYLDEAASRMPDATHQDLLKTALDLYNGEIIRRVRDISEPVLLNIKAGDTVIWHPEMPHGGSPAKDQHRTRWSIVAHCAPSNIQVYQHEQFFLNRDQVSLQQRYGYKKWGNRNIALAGDVAYM
jgi:phytanoyl-CoA hydroxylase